MRQIATESPGEIPGYSEIPGYRQGDTLSNCIEKDLKLLALKYSKFSRNMFDLETLHKESKSKIDKMILEITQIIDGNNLFKEHEFDNYIVLFQSVRNVLDDAKKKLEGFNWTRVGRFVFMTERRTIKEIAERLNIDRSKLPESLNSFNGYYNGMTLRESIDKDMQLISFHCSDFMGFRLGLIENLVADILLLNRIVSELVKARGKIETE